jgi:hypothetical protein
MENFVQKMETLKSKMTGCHSNKLPLGFGKFGGMAFGVSG